MVPEAHSYNLRGLLVPPVLLLFAALHLLLAIYAEAGLGPEEGCVPCCEWAR